MIWLHDWLECEISPFWGFDGSHVTSKFGNDFQKRKFSGGVIFDNIPKKDISFLGQSYQIWK